MASVSELQPVIPPHAGPSAHPRPMIVADDAHVTYRVYASGKRVSPRENSLSLNALRGGRKLQAVPALRGVTFTASEGETIGVVGHNGSGKSTLFRAMSGLIPTSAGTIWAADRPVLLGVNAALIPELSGANNIKLGLLAMGFTADEAEAHVDEIADFAELNEFIDHPMRTYSAGMGARLRFAIASAKAHSILLVDEALAVGDRRFRAKSEQRIRELRDSAGLVMIVSHSVSSLQDTCERVLWIHKGELRADGAAKEVIDDYVKWTKQPGSAAVGAASTAKTRPPAAKAKPLPVAQSEPVPPREAEAAPVVAETAAPRNTLSPLEQLLADAAMDVKTIIVPAESPRTVARRDRFRRTSRERTRRRIIAVAIAGVAVLLAVSAGAAIALLTNAPEPPARPASPGASSPPGSAAPPLIVGFAASAASIVCTGTDAEAFVKLSWRVDAATLIAVGAGPSQIDALEEPLQSALPAVADEHEVPFTCSDDVLAYTLTAESADGSRISSVVTVSRELAPEPQAEEPSTPRGDSHPGAPTQPGATTPPSETPAPVQTPAPEETTPPEEATPPEETPAPEETTPPEESTTPAEPAPPEEPSPPHETAAPEIVTP